MNVKSYFLLSLACAVAPLLAQTNAPSAAHMVEQLKTPPTRSLRNLVIEPTIGSVQPSENGNSQSHDPVTNPPAGRPVRPSLSLQIQFDFNSARVRPESERALANLSLALQSPELLASNFAIEGHTDAKGNPDFNMKLSEQRAMAVRDFLKLRGVLPDRLIVSGKGSTDLANDAAPYSAENRRVRIVNLD
jgi:outer membrane protein OmpA-like peptidoglycan-associated protein